jgi:hypothetical protein
MATPRNRRFTRTIALATASESAKPIGSEPRPGSAMLCQTRPVEPIVRTGGCLCGSVRYRVVGEPFHVGCCHCADCRKESGSAFTVYAQWPRSAFEISGELATYHGRSFCPRCGSRLVCLNEAAVEIRIGSLDAAPFHLQPEAEIWIKRREPWLSPVEGASQHDENRH